MTNRIIKFINNMINDNETSRNNIIERLSQTQEAISHSCSSEVFDKVNPLIQDALVPLIEAKHLEAQEQLETLSHLVTQEDHNNNSDLSLFGCISNVFDLFSCGNDLDEA